MSWRDCLDPNAPAGAFLSWKRVEPRVGISRTTAWRLQQTDAFPRPYVVSAGRVAWLEREIEAWRASRGQRADRGARAAPPPIPMAAIPEMFAPAPRETPVDTGSVTAPHATPSAVAPSAAGPKAKGAPSQQLTLDL